MSFKLNRVIAREIFQGVQFSALSPLSPWQKCRGIISRWKCAKSFAVYVPTVIAPDSIFDIRFWLYWFNLNTPRFIAGYDRFSYINIISPHLPLLPLTSPPSCPRDYESLISVLQEWTWMKMGYLLNQRYPTRWEWLQSSRHLLIIKFNSDTFRLRTYVYQLIQLKRKDSTRGQLSCFIKTTRFTDPISGRR